VRPGQHRRIPNWGVALIAIVVIAIGVAWAFTKEFPWADSYEVQAVFPSAQNVRLDSPVRIAGVDVGKVTKVEPLGPEAQDVVESSDESEDTAGSGDTASTDPESTSEAAAVVTMEIEEDGRPIKTDATFRLLPRLFLEGNLFVDLKPGSPSAPEAEEGHAFPLDQTSNSVQLDQILTTLQADVRDQLQIALEEFGSALVDHGGAEGFQELYRSSPGANKFTSQVNEAFLGQNPHDLSGLIRNLDRVVRGLGRNEEALKDLVTNFRIFSGSFAAEDQALEQAIIELPQVFREGDTAFAALNRAFPPLRAWAREMLPGTRTAPEALDAATPLLRQVRLLMSERELRGLVADLDPAVENLAAVAEGSPATFNKVRKFSSCFNEVLIPWQNMTVPAQGHPATGRVYQEAAYSLVGIGGESRSGDANGQYIRTLGAGGINTLSPDSSTSQFIFSPNPEGGDSLVGVVPFPILGAEPNIEDSVKPKFAPNEPCETQEPPNLATRAGGTPTQEPTGGLGGLPVEFTETMEEFERIAMDLGEAQEANEKAKSGETKREEADALAAWIEFSEEYTDRATAALTGKGAGGGDEESGGVEADGGEEE
jgi:phospholipid/cholesterol/gamma-HCH transport system substrate-binding protein